MFGRRGDKNKGDPYVQSEPEKSGPAAEPKSKAGPVAVASRSAGRAEAVTSFVNWGLDSGQAVATDLGYLALPAPVVDLPEKRPRADQITRENGDGFDGNQSPIQIVKGSDLHRFVVLPKRWIIELTFAWIKRLTRPSLCS